MPTFRLFVCAATLSLAACGGSQLVTPRSLPTEFQSWGDNMPLIGGPIATASAGAVTVTGVLTTPTPCYEIEGSAALQARRLTMLVDAREVGQACIQVIGRTRYSLTARGLASGPYSVSVRHRRIEDGVVRDSTVTELSVIVP